jgi:ComF family protein
MTKPLQSLFEAGQRWSGLALDAILPPRCLGCGVLVDHQGNFCAGCWRNLHVLSEPLCLCCGIPFSHGTQAQMTCAACLANPPAFGRARSVWAHDAAARDSVLAFKYADKPQLARALSGHLLRAGRALAADPATVLVPVPLHRWRLLGRRYNQAAELARHLGAALGRPVLADALVRVRATQPQQGLTALARQRNVSRAFNVRAKAAQRLRGAPVLLIDDVLTTGATAEACAKKLLRAGATRVDVLTLTRVVKAD